MMRCWYSFITSYSVMSYLYFTCITHLYNRSSSSVWQGAGTLRSILLLHKLTFNWIVFSVHCLAKYVVGPQGLGQEKVAGPAKNSNDMLIADVIYIFQPTKFSKLIPTPNKLHIHTATYLYKYSYKSTH